MTPEQKIESLGLALPPPIVLPPTLHLPFTFINVRADRATISGHPRHDDSGAINGPFGQVGKDLTMQEPTMEDLTTEDPTT